MKSALLWISMVLNVFTASYIVFDDFDDAAEYRHVKAELAYLREVASKF